MSRVGAQVGRAPARGKKVTKKTVKLAESTVSKIVKYEKLLPLDIYKDLMSIKLFDDDSTLQLPRDNELFYNLIYKIELNGYTEVKNFLISNKEKWKSTKEIYFAFSEFEVSKIKFRNDIETYHIQPIVSKGLYQCPKCSSRNTLDNSAQTRRGDEGVTVKAYCTDCTYSWRISS